MMKPYLKLFAIFCFAFIVPGICQAFNRWPDTGQTTSYTTTFGEDSDYTINPKSYTKLASGGVELADTATFPEGWIMTRDNVTGLVWENKTDVTGSINNKDDTYTWCDTNSATNGGNPGTCGDKDTTDFITALNSQSFGGYTDWRLPTIKELSTIVNCEGNMNIDITFFPNTGYISYWSSTNNFYNNVYAWSVSFVTGVVGTSGKVSLLHVRAVRAGQ